MLVCTMLRRLAGGASLRQCRVNDIQRKQRSRLTIGLGMAVIIFLLLCTVACGGSDGSLAKGGLNMVVVSGQAGIRSGGGNILVEEGQEAVITAGDQIVADEAGVKLLLADGSLLYLNPDTDLQVVAFSAEGTARLSQLKGRLEVEAASPLLTVKISTFVSDAFVLKTMQFTATPAVRDTTFRLWIDGDNAHLTVEAGEVNVANDDSTATISAGSEVIAIPGGELIVSQIAATAKPTATATPTITLVPTATPTGLTHPSPTATVTSTPTPTPTPEFLYSAPGLLGPEDGSDFEGDETILLLWGTPAPLSGDEWYEVQLWKEGNVPYTVVDRVKEGTWKVDYYTYYPGHYQWRVLIVRGQEEGRKEMNLSPPSRTRSFGWLTPPTPTVPATATTSPTATPSPPVTETPDIEALPVDLTVYMRSTNNAEHFVAFSGEDVEAGTIYNEGGTVFGSVAVQIGDKVYHYDDTLASGELEPLPAPYRLEFEFSDSLIAATGGKPWSDPQRAQFSVGKLHCESDTLPDEPYKIEMTLYAGQEPRKHTEVSFHVADSPGCDATGADDEGGGGPPVRP